MVKVVERDTGKTYSGKIAIIKGDSVNLWSGVMSDKKGGFRGCGKKWVFVQGAVTLEADNPEVEIKQS